MSTRTLVSWALLVGLTWAQGHGPVVDVDSDRDGLSDFHEIHKHFTDPKKADSDGDGKPDGDWLERRDYQYTVRTVVHVMKPVTPDFLTDDYQDARVLDETDMWMELEVIHYPFNTVATAIKGNRDWRTSARNLKPWLDPGPTSDWTPELRRDLIAALAKDGIDVAKLDDKTLVEEASSWLLKRAEHKDGFTSFVTAFDDRGRPFVPEELKENAASGVREKGLSLEEQWEREVSAKGMFKHRTRGSCTSSAIYLNGCLRALGIPTRTILCIPAADANDAHELGLVERGLSHNEVRRTVTEALAGLEGSWASHTFNEVFVGGRWHRLNYNRLGQNIYDGGLFGLMTHIATFRDWADAEMPKTVGRRSKLKLRNDVFGGPNPYSLIAIRDAFGPHCKLENPQVKPDVVRLDRVHWTDAQDLPSHIREGCASSGRFGLIAHLSGVPGFERFKSFIQDVDQRVFLEADGQSPLKIGFDPGCWWYEDGRCWIYIPFGPADRRDLVEGVDYEVRLRNESDAARWEMGQEKLVVRR